MYHFQKLSISSFCILSIFLISLIIYPQSFYSASNAALIGVDFGSEFEKVSLVKPGSFHLVIDEQSQRKIPTVIAFIDGERFFGNGATQFSVKKPKETFAFIQRLAGKLYDDPIVQEFKKELWPFELVPTPRNTIGLHVPSLNTTYTVEEILSMSLSHLVKISESDVGEKGTVKDCVLTVPHHFDYFQRQALIDAADLIDLNVLSLINENTAAAIQYGIDKPYAENDTSVSNIMLYNMGSTSTKVNIVQYQAITVKTGKISKKTFGQAAIKCASFDQSLGGTAFQMRLAHHLISEVNKQLKSKGINEDISESPKSVNKIKLAAEKAKIVLSANQETPVYLTGLTNDMDFKVDLTRELFQDLSKDLLDRVAKPIDDCLNQSSLKPSDLDQLIIIGGSVRIPAVQQRIKDHIQRDTLGQSLNGDESMAFGAGVHAANLSTLFQLRPFGVADITLNPIEVRINELGVLGKDALNDNDLAEGKFSKKTALFKKFNALNKRKTVAWNHTSDFSVTLVSDDKILMGYNVTGLSSALKTEKYQKLLESEIQPRVSLSFLLDGSSLAQLVKAEATLEDTMKVPIVKKKNSTVTNSTESNTNSTTEEIRENDLSANEEINAGNDTTAESNATASSSDENPEIEYKIKKVTRTIPLIIAKSLHSAHVQPMSFADKKAARERLAHLQVKDEERRAIAKAKNDLESFIYAKRAQVNDVQVEQVTNEAQREEIMRALLEGEDWLYDVSEESIQVYKDKLSELKKLYDPVQLRLSELTERPNSLNATAKLIEHTKKQIEEFRVNRTWLAATEIDSLENKVKELEMWLQKVVQEQEAKAGHEELAFTSVEVYQKLKPIMSQTQTLATKKKPVTKSPKKKSNKKTQKNETAAENEAQSENSGTEEGSEQSESETHQTEMKEENSSETPTQSKESEIKTGSTPKTDQHQHSDL